jgi:hypothetical protein
MLKWVEGTMVRVVLPLWVPRLESQSSGGVTELGAPIHLLRVSAQ